MSELDWAPDGASVEIAHRVRERIRQLCEPHGFVVDVVASSDDDDEDEDQFVSYASGIVDYEVSADGIDVFDHCIGEVIVAKAAEKIADGIHDGHGCTKEMHTEIVCAMQEVHTKNLEYPGSIVAVRIHADDYTDSEVTVIVLLDIVTIKAYPGQEPRKIEDMILQGEDLSVVGWTDQMVANLLGEGLGNPLGGQ